jgi:tRNA dimethylallyltransferase
MRRMIDIDALPADRPVLLAGPTASGKSALALEIAQAQGRVIVNADALQVYACWHILTARPSAEDESQVPHHLYGHVGWNQAWSVGHWLRAVQDLLQRHPNPVIVGGTGLYFMALTEGLAEIPPTPPDIRVQADARLAAEGASALLAELDPATRARIDTLNPVRVQRAWEVQASTGRGLAAWQDDTAPPLLAEAAKLVLHPDPAWLAARIDTRFDLMMTAGALDEVRANLDHWTPKLSSMKAHGAPELVAYLRGTMSFDDAITRAKTNTRQYAKRQRTWARARMSGWRAIIPK